MAIGLVSGGVLRNLSRRSGGAASNALVLGLLLAAVGLLILYGRQVSDGYVREAPVELTLSALPAYAGLSLARCLAAMVLSLAFTLVYGSIAAHSRRGERFMIPALDVLQTIPVLSFLPPVTLALITLVPGSEFGLEAACIIMIFTGQAWNMAFGFYQSIRSVPPALYEVAAVHRLGPLRTFFKIELPASTIGLIYNSMMSFAGGWFFLTTIEMFTLQNRDFRLPGIGSWLAMAQQQHRWDLVVVGSVVLIVLIVGTDQLLFRPLLCWAQRFKVEEQESQTPPRSWVVRLWKRAPIIGALRRRRARRRDRAPATVNAAGQRRRRLPVAVPSSGWGPAAARVLVRLTLVVFGVAGLWALIRLVQPLPWSGDAGSSGWADVGLGLAASFGRVVAVLIIGSLWAIPIGLAIGRSARLRSWLGPIVQVVASYPSPAYFVVLTVALTSIGLPFWITAALLMLMGSQWYILFNAMSGAMAIPTELTELSSAYRLSRWRRLWRVELPAMFPALVTGWVTAAGGAWNTTIVAEYIQTGTEASDVLTTAGIGELIASATDRGDFALLAASTLSLAVFIVVFNRLVWNRLYRLCATRFNLQT
ncbi:MAG: ABC transporter permease subunit [Phycisphaerales bacterium]|nr:ABC transporter permease subunit [Phycisphaerales bacterium]